MEKPYKRISCSIYDHLEARAVKKQKLTIQLKGEEDKEILIVDLFTKDGAEYLKTSENEVIRLDQMTIKTKLDGIDSSFC